MFTFNGLETRALNGDVMVSYGVEIFMSFFSIWDVCAIIGCRMIVWQGSYQVKYGR